MERLKKSCKISSSSASNKGKEVESRMQADSFDQIYRDYFEPVYRYALSLSGNPQTAEEIAQETFFKALRNLDQFQGKSSLKSWLCAIAKNLWLSEQRKKKDLTIDDALPVPDPSIGPEEAIVRQDESMRIHRLLHHLDEPYREVFTLRALGQLSFRDIGDLGKSENWACVVFHRARTRIKEKMEE